MSISKFENIRKATLEDVSRIAEILIFTKRMQYRFIFNNDHVSFGEMQVLPLAQEYIDHPERLDTMWLYDDGLVKGLIHIEDQEVKELYVDSFFQATGVGSRLMDFAVEEFNANHLLVLEKNESSIGFYESRGFHKTSIKLPEEGTPEFLIQMER